MTLRANEHGNHVAKRLIVAQWMSQWWRAQTIVVCRSLSNITVLQHVMISIPRVLQQSRNARAGSSSQKYQSDNFMLAKSSMLTLTYLQICSASVSLSADIWIRSFASSTVGQSCPLIANKTSSRHRWLADFPTGSTCNECYSITTVLLSPLVHVHGYRELWLINRSRQTS